MGNAAGAAFDALVEMTRNTDKEIEKKQGERRNLVEQIRELIRPIVHKFNQEVKSEYTVNGFDVKVYTGSIVITAEDLTFRGVEDVVQGGSLTDKDTDPIVKGLAEIAKKFLGDSNIEFRVAPDYYGK